jgi:hypothetical protein
MQRAREPLSDSILIGECRRRKREHKGTHEVSEIFRTLVTFARDLRLRRLRNGSVARKLWEM